MSTYRDVLRRGPTGPWASTIMGELSRSRLSHDKIIIRAIKPSSIIPGCILRKLGISDDISTGYTCDNRHPPTGLGLPPYIIITHKRWQSVKPRCALYTNGWDHSSICTTIACGSAGLLIRRSRFQYPENLTTKGRDGEPVARVPLMARDTIFWARHRSKRKNWHVDLKRFATPELGVFMSFNPTLACGNSQLDISNIRTPPIEQHGNTTRHAHLEDQLRLHVMKLDSNIYICDESPTLQVSVGVKPTRTAQLASRIRASTPANLRIT
ncbi:hypothetical protein TNCV_2926931 [Trichonephila clavipes]|nr:hypothetical protein TNCV_2926931 [Trichonephila clavipes]